MTDLLPLREGCRPLTSNELPHGQLDQQPCDSRYVDAILVEALKWRSVLGQPSAIAVEGARALALHSSAAGGPTEGFLVGREFCHVHAKGDFSLHSALPLPVVAAAERAGWAEPHYLVQNGQAPGTIVMFYAPRNDLERAVVLRLVRGFVRVRPRGRDRRLHG